MSNLNESLPENQEMADFGDSAGMSSLDQAPLKSIESNIDRYYVDCTVASSDQQDGSPNHPWRTLAPFIKLAKSGGHDDIRCWIKTPGVYAIDDVATLSDVVLHIGVLSSAVPSSSSKKVTIKLVRHYDSAEDTASVAIYNSHLNFEGTAKVPLLVKVAGAVVDKDEKVTKTIDSGRIHGDNCHITFTKVELTQNQYWYGSTLKFIDCTVGQSGFQQSNVRYDGTTTKVERVANGNAALTFIDSKAHFLTAVTAVARSSYAAKNYFIYAVSSQITFDKLTPSNTSSIKAKEEYVINTNACLLQGSGVNAASKSALSGKTRFVGGTILAGKGSFVASE